MMIQSISVMSALQAERNELEKMGSFTPPVSGCPKSDAGLLLKRATLYRKLSAGLSIPLGGFMTPKPPAVRPQSINLFRQIGLLSDAVEA